MDTSVAFPHAPETEHGPFSESVSPTAAFTRAVQLLRPLLALLMLAMLSSITPPFPFGRDPAPDKYIVPTHAAQSGAAISAGATPADLLPIAPVEAIVVNAKRPIDGNLEAIAPFSLSVAGDDRDRAIDCLAAAAWYEAGDDPRGERAVIQVVLNRARHPSYPKTVCGVVFEGADRRTGCQFTFTCDGALARTPNSAAWRRARALAQAGLDGAVDASVGGATHYHADYVVPRWAPNLDKLAQVGAHIFYRFRGSWGRTAVFRSAGDRPEPAITRLARLAPIHAGGDPVELADTSGTELPVPTGDASGPAAATSRSLSFSVRSPALGSLKDSTLAVAVDPSVPAGRWALQAMSRCAGRADCQVMAWSSAAKADANRLRAPADRDRPVFLFVRDRASGMEVTMWDCAVAARPDPSQCLPPEGAALRRLMRARPPAPATERG